MLGSDGERYTGLCSCSFIGLLLVSWSSLHCLARSLLRVTVDCGPCTLLPIASDFLRPRVMISTILLVVVGQYRLIVCSTAPAVIISRPFSSYLQHCTMRASSCFKLSDTHFSWWFPIRLIACDLHISSFVLSVVHSLVCLGNFSSLHRKRSICKQRESFIVH